VTSRTEAIRLPDSQDTITWLQTQRILRKSGDSLVWDLKMLNSVASALLKSMQAVDCGACETKFQDLQSYEAHLKDKKHAVALKHYSAQTHSPVQADQQLQQQQENNYSEAYFCNTCNVGFRIEKELAMHLKSRKHLQELLSAHEAAARVSPEEENMTSMIEINDPCGKDNAEFRTSRGKPLGIIFSIKNLHKDIELTFKHCRLVSDKQLNCFSLKTISQKSKVKGEIAKIPPNNSFSIQVTCKATELKYQVYELQEKSKFFAKILI
jgi:hypothetical protein